MKVRINEIQEITSLLLLKLKEKMGNEIEINNDYYWDISDNELYNPYEEPKNITLGQLSDDLDEIKRLLTSNDSVPYDLKRISNILKTLTIENSTIF